jgi:regulator of nonsense transcripts 2
VSSESLRKQEEEEAKRKQEREEAEARAAEAKNRREAEELGTRARESRDALKSFLDAVAKHRAYRSALQPDALEVSRKGFEAGKKSLKTDLKKCTAFVKKVKSGSVWSAKVEDILKDVGTLNLSRYVEEVAKGVLESKPKVTDIPAIVALCVAMHERYAEFLPTLLPPVLEIVQGRGDAEAAKSKRLCLRLLTEFLLVGLVTETKTLLKCVADATGAGKDGNGGETYAVQDGNLVVAFSRAAGLEVFGTIPRSIQRAVQFFLSEKERVDASTSILSSTPDKEIVAQGYALSMELESAAPELAVSAEVSELFTKHCRGAYRFLASSLVQTHGKLQKLERRCEQDRLLSGTLPEAREAGLADARKLKENLHKSVEALSDVLDEDSPVLLDDVDAAGREAGAGVEVWTKGAGEEEDFGPFDDEETRDFYFDIPDLIATIPPALLGLTPDQIQKRKEENLKKYGRDADAGADADLNLADDSLQVTPATEAELDANESGQKLDDVIGDDDNVDDGGKALLLGELFRSIDRCISSHRSTRLCNPVDDKNTPRYKLLALLEEELPECNRREQVDELVERFCTNFGSNKNARKRLSKALFLVPRNRFDVIPYYSRVAAIADRVWPEVSSPLVTDLEQQFHGQAKFKKNQNLDSRFKTARYIGELTKFRVAPPIVFLRCIRRCLDDFTGGNVEVSCCLLETCGRFLYRLKHTSSRISDIMDTMTKLSKAKVSGTDLKYTSETLK